MPILLIDKIKPKNNGDFPLVDAVDVEMPNGTRLPDALKNVQSSGYVVSAEPPTDTRMLWLDPNDGGGSEYEEFNAAMDEIDTLIGGDE